MLNKSQENQKNSLSHYFDIVYRIETPDPEAVKKLIQEINSITGLECHQVYDSSGKVLPIQ